ncbi:MAG: hypothetical protein ACTSWN_00295, partial [Promethearchaeota archaeon]
ILKRIGGDNKLELEHKSKDPNTLYIRTKSAKSTKTFKLKSKEINELDLIEEDADLKYDETLGSRIASTFQLESSLLDEIIKDASIISEIIKIQVVPAEKVVIFQAEDESGELEVEIDLEGEGVLDYDVKNESEGSYSLNFLENILKIQSIVDSFSISLGNNIPIKIEGSLPVENGKVVYFLAPRIEDDADYEDEFEYDDMDFESEEEDDFLDDEIEDLDE